MNRRTVYALAAATLLATGCIGGRYVSADSDLEAIYRGRSYYEVVDDFGRPDATVDDGMQGTVAIYSGVSLNGTRAAGLYSQYIVRNRTTHEEGEPVGDVAFSFNSKMRCYAVDSDFQHRRVRAPKEAKPEPSRDPDRPVWETPRVPRSLEFPTVERRSPAAEVVRIERVDVKEDGVKVYFHYQARTPKHRPLNDCGINLNHDVYMEDADTRVRYAMREVDGIAFYPDSTQFAHNVGGYDVFNYSITFEPMSRETVRINIIEPGHSGFNFYGVDVKTRINPRID
ncbi:MAG: hypothetical protein IJ760_00280 [Bacteroidales bacterium]|nr:hypothetical protein [Bacteroidales bacterium]